LAAQRFSVAGAAIADSDEDGFRTFIGSVPELLPEGIVNEEQVRPGGKLAATGQVTTTAPVNPPVRVSVIVEFPVEVVPAAPAAVATVALLAVCVKVPPEEFTVKVTLLEVPPPGVGFVTVTAGVPAVAMSDARMEAVSWVAVTNVVAFAAPPKFTVDVLTKFVPFTVRVNAGPPAVAVEGESVVIVGTGLLDWLIVRVGGFKFVSGPPPGCGVNRSMGTTAAVAKSESGSFTVKEVAEQAVMFDLTAPLKRTTVALAPPQMIEPPLTVSEKFVVPVVVVVGLMVLIAGIGFKIVKGTPFVGFGCAGSVTVTVADAPLAN